MFSMKRFLLRAKKYFKENLGAPFIVAFQALLLVCAGLLIGDSSVWADGLTVVAYYSLVIGVILQLISQRISPRIRIPRIRIRITKPKHFLRRACFNEPRDISKKTKSIVRHSVPVCQNPVPMATTRAFRYNCYYSDSDSSLRDSLFIKSIYHMI